MPHELTPASDIGAYDLLEPQVVLKPSISHKKYGLRLEIFFYLLATLAYGGHVFVIFKAMGGASGLIGKDTILRDDHPLYFHSSLVTRDFIKSSISTAGYDHRFMGGYAKSAVFPASSNLPELTLALSKNWLSPAVAYKFYVFVSAILAPFFVWLAARGLAESDLAGAIALVASLLYVWTDFPSQYIGFGMLPYFLSIPLAMLTLLACIRWLEKSVLKRWLVMTLLLAITTLVHFTALMVLAPAAIAAWIFSENKSQKAAAAILSIVVTLISNSFWWLPGVLLAKTKGESGFAFAHPEGMLERLGKIAWSEAPIEPLLILGLLAGMPIFWKRSKIAAAGLAGFAAGGFFWGYAAGAFRSLDFLQPGRHTYAFYLAASVAGGYFLTFLLEWLRRSHRQASTGFICGLLLLAIRLYGPIVYAVYFQWVGVPVALASTPPPALFSSLKQAMKANIQSGSRVFYEEGGFGGDPFAGGRYSGVLANDLDIEMIGGPYLHASLTTNLAQFGEGKLFGRENWDLAWLEEVAGRYGVSSILCWSDRARALVDANPGSFEVLYRNGPFRLARINKTATLKPAYPLFGKEFVVGDSSVEGGKFRFKIKPAEPGIAVDRIVVLRYHWVPNLRVLGSDSVQVVPEILPDNRFPPLIKLLLKPSAKGDLTLELDTWGRGE